MREGVIELRSKESGGDNYAERGQMRESERDRGREEQ
jgi:hypothetical protein